MGETTGISWTDHTFNPWWGCQKVSPGCAHCYAEHLAVDRRKMPIWGPASTTHRKMMSENYWKQPLKWDRLAAESGRRARVFAASMADVFEHHPEVVEARARLWNLIAQTPHLDWLLLTKRPENINEMLPENWGEGWDNVWLGTSVENQEQADKRIEQLFSVPMRVSFLSCEPLLGPIDILYYLADGRPGRGGYTRLIDWVIVGGESGPGCRPMDAVWARSLRNQCEEAGTAFFFKQHGGTRRIDGTWGGDKLFGLQYHQWPDSPIVPAEPLSQLSMF